MVGESTLRIVEKQSGKTVQRVAVDPPHFGEGIAIHGREIVMLTWQTGIAFRFDRESLVPLGTFRYDGEGWGLACDGKYFFRSDGTSRIRLHNPADFKTVSDFRVVDRGRPVERLNELEFVRGELWANVWKTDRIVRINPQTGRVVGWVDLKDVYPQSERPAAADVMNGIAWDSQSGHVLVTGKRWPWLFELEVR